MFSRFTRNRRQHINNKLGTYLSKEAVEEFTVEKTEQKIRGVSKKGFIAGPDLAPVHDAAENLERLLQINESR